MIRKNLILFSFCIFFFSCKFHSEIQSIGIICDAKENIYQAILECNTNDIVTFTYYFIPDNNCNTPTKIVFDPQYFKFISYSEKEYKLQALKNGFTKVSIRTKVSCEENYDSNYDYLNKYDEFCKKNNVLSNTTMEIKIK